MFDRTVIRTNCVESGVNVSVTHADQDNITKIPASQVRDLGPGNNTVSLGFVGRVGDQQVLNSDNDNYVACSPIDVCLEKLCMLVANQGQINLRSGQQVYYSVN